MFSGFFSSSASASRPSWKSTRRMSSAWRCSSTSWSDGTAGRTRSAAPSAGRRQPDVGDQELVVEHLAGIRQAEQVPHRAAHAVAGDQPVGLERRSAPSGVSTVSVTPSSRGATPTTLLRWRISISGSARAALVEIFLDVVLLQVHEGRELVAGLGQQVEAVDRLVAQIDLALLPGDALLDHALGDAEAVPDLEAALGLADRAAAEARPCRRRRARTTGTPRVARTSASVGPAMPAPTMTTGRRVPAVELAGRT